MGDRLTDEEISKALNGTFLGGNFDYINRWKGNVESVEVRPSPELREIADIFCAIGEARGRVLGMGEAERMVRKVVEMSQSTLRQTETGQLISKLIGEIADAIRQVSAQATERPCDDCEANLADCDRSVGARQGCAAQTAAQPAEMCEWAMIDDCNMLGCFETACDNVQYFSEGDVGHNGYKFCPYCGKPIKVKGYTPTSGCTLGASRRLRCLSHSLRWGAMGKKRGWENG